MLRTISERVFERFCAHQGIAYLRVPESETRTPDYELLFGTRRIVVEVKEIAQSKEEQDSDRLARERGYGTVLSFTPGERVRRKIADSSGQIKARAVGTLPSILVLFDSGRVASHIDPYNLRVGMYGLEQIHIAVPPIGAGSPYATGMGYGAKRKMTPEHNTSISAVGALFMTAPDTTFLHVYHNRFARIPLEHALLEEYGIEQFELDEETVGAASKWRSIVATAHVQPGT